MSVQAAQGLGSEGIVLPSGCSQDMVTVENMPTVQPGLSQEHTLPAARTSWELAMHQIPTGASGAQKKTQVWTGYHWG